MCVEKKLNTKEKTVMASESKRPVAAAAAAVIVTPFLGDAPRTDLDIGAALAAGADTTVIARLTQCFADPTFRAENGLNAKAKCRNCKKGRKCGLFQVGDIFAALKGVPTSDAATLPGHCDACSVSLKMYRVGMYPQAHDSFCLWNTSSDSGAVCLSRDSPETLKSMWRLCRGCRDCASCCNDNPSLFQVQRDLIARDPNTPDIPVAANHYSVINCIRTTETSPHPPYVELEAKGTAMYVYKMTMPLEIRKQRGEAAELTTKTAELKRALADGICFEPGSQLHMKWQWARQQGYVVYPLPDDLKDAEMNSNALNTATDFRVADEGTEGGALYNEAPFPYDTLYRENKQDYAAAKKPDVDMHGLVSYIARPIASLLANYESARSVNMEGKTEATLAAVLATRGSPLRLDDKVPYAFLPRDYVVFKIPIDPRASSQAKGCMSSWALTAADRSKPISATNYLFTTRLLAEMEKKMPYQDFIRWALRSLRRVTPRAWLPPVAPGEPEGESKQDARIAEVAHRIRLDETHRLEIAERMKVARENRRAVADLLEPLQQDMLRAHEQNASLPLLEKHGLKCCMRADGKAPRKTKRKLEPSTEAFDCKVDRRASVLASALVDEDLVDKDVLRDPRKLAMLHGKCRRLAAKCLAPEPYPVSRKAPACLSWTVVPAVPKTSAKSTKKPKIWSDRKVEGTGGTREGEPQT